MSDYSAQFRVKHACGHIESHPRLLTPEEEERYQDQSELLQAREQALIQLEEQVCLNCYSRGVAESQFAHLRRLGVPLGNLPLLLGGTDKQTHWARKIRSDKLAEIIVEYERFRDRLEAQVRQGLITAHEAMRRREWCNRSVVWVATQHDPEWWINQRERTGWELVRLAARSVR